MSAAFTVVKNFMRKGFHLSGCGYYAAVFESQQDPNLVYKVGRTTYDPFLLYAAQTEFRSNPHFPRIYKLTVFDDWYIAQIEALTPVPEHKRALTKRISESAYKNELSMLESESLRQLISRIKQLVETNKDLQLDLHPGNIMMRGIVPVITDPISEYSLYTASDMESWFEQRGVNPWKKDT